MPIDLTIDQLSVLSSISTTDRLLARRSGIDYYITWASILGTANNFTATQSIVTSGSVSSLVIQDVGANGANIKLIGNGGTTPNKTIRAEGGNLAFVNSAGSSVVSYMTDSGVWNIQGLTLLDTTADLVWNRSADDMSIVQGATSYTNGRKLVFQKQGGGQMREVKFDTEGVQILNGGLYVGSPTGGNKGSGTANFAGEIYKNNTAYTNPDYVLEFFYTGKIEKFINNEGAREYHGMMSLDDLEKYVSKHFRLPHIRDGAMGAFERSDKMLLIAEELVLYLFNHEKRLKSLEKGIIA